MASAKQTEDPLSVQDRLKDMQSLLILQNIRGQHDENPTVLSAIDHAIGIISKRISKRDEQVATGDIGLNFARSVIEAVERGEGWVSNYGAERVIDDISMTMLNDVAVKSMAVSARMKYTFEVTANGGNVQK